MGSSSQSSGGTGGVTDGFIRGTYSALVGLGSTGYVTWSSPAFTPSTPLEAASVSFASRASTGALGTGAAALQIRAVDQTVPASSTILIAAQTLTNTSVWETTTISVPLASLNTAHSYKLEFRLAFTSSVAASATADIDDVVLSMSDLDPPTALSASFAPSPPSRIAGSVTTDGSTNIDVDYGPTASYGSTASTTVSASGPQTYSISLPGLTAGATYHYRVMAMNVDGSTATSDATFTAPDAPIATAPTWSGALNATARIVTFTLGSSTAATVEILNGADAVVQTLPDSNVDGSVAVTLPSDDGTYKARVIRDNGYFQTTSSATNTTLDTAAPSLLGVNMAVTPLVSNQVTRAVTATIPGDAATATAQVLDLLENPVGSPVDIADGSADVNLGAGDGIYRVRLVLTDAAGNSATTTSLVLILDTDLPSLDLVNLDVSPVVSNQTTRAVTATIPGVAEIANLQVLDSANNPVGSPVDILSGSANVNLSGGDGTYHVRLSVADLAGNIATLTSQGLTLDTLAPSLSAIGLSVTPTLSGDATRQVSLNVPTDAVTASAQVVDDADNPVGGSVDIADGTANVTLGQDDGDYRVRLTFTDAAGNSTTTFSPVLTLDTSAPLLGDVGLSISPSLSNSTTRHVTFATPLGAATALLQVFDEDDNPVGGPIEALDGDANIALGPTDGEYRVALTVTNALGFSASILSSALTLDTIPPDTGATNLGVGPLGSADRNRDVTLTMPPGAVSAVLQLLDSNGTEVGAPIDAQTGDANISLGPGDGTYRVRVTLTDAAGNTSTITSGDLVLDTTGPDAGPAPIVTGLGSSRSRSITFTRDSTTDAAFIDILNSAGDLIETIPVPLGVSADILLPDLDGIYSAVIRQLDIFGNETTGDPTEITLLRPTENQAASPSLSATPSQTGDGLTQMLGSCFGARVALLDVRAGSSSVKFSGAAGYPTGTEVIIRNQKLVRVARTTLNSKGEFKATARLPRERQQEVAQYTAWVGNRHSRRLALKRANTIRLLRTVGGLGYLEGRFARNLHYWGSKLQVHGGVGPTACAGGGRKLKIVGKVDFHPTSGLYRLRFLIPRGQGALTVRVMAPLDGRKTYTTFRLAN